MNPLLVIFIVLSVVSPVRYIAQTVRGKVRPHRVTRLVIWLASLVSLISVIGSNSFAGRMFAGVFFVRATILLLAALRYGAGGRTTLDTLCLILGAAGVVLSITDNGLLGILLALIADLIGYIPAFIKTYRQPSSEEPWFYILESLAALIIIYDVADMRMEIILPLYFVATNLTMLALMYAPKRSQRGH